MGRELARANACSDHECVRRHGILPVLCNSRQRAYGKTTLGAGEVQPTPPENMAKLQEVFRLYGGAAQDQARHYNLRRREWSPRIADIVWSKKHHLSRRPKDSRRN